MNTRGLSLSESSSDGVSRVKSMLAALRRAMRRLLSRYPEGELIPALRSALEPVESIVARHDGVTVAVESVEDPLYYALFAALTLELRQGFGARAELVVVRSVNGAVGRSLLHELARSALVGAILSAQWIRAYRGIMDRVAYRSQSWRYPAQDLFDWLRSRNLWRRLQDTADVERLEIDGVRVGDLIIDSYLRFRPAPRFDCRDPFTLRLIWQAHRDIRRARDYFRARKPALYVTSYSTYVEHGVAARVAILEGVRVRSFGNFSQFGKELTRSDWYHTADTTRYKAVFQAMDRQDECLQRAEEQLRVRLGGGIDVATAYMSVSAYAQSREPLPDVRGAVVVFLHDFYDSPHIYPDLLFADFWSWICLTVEVLTAAGTKFFVKPHPNQISLSGDAIRALQHQYPDLPILSSRVTNVQLADAGIVCGVTVYGTVAHELAYFGIPTIACARHPHSAFEFCRTAATVAQYVNYLRSPAELPIPREQMRREALAFYYMHNLHGSEERLNLRRQFVALWKACHDSGPPTGAAEQLAAFRWLPAFKEFVAEIGAEVSTDAR